MAPDSTRSTLPPAAKAVARAVTDVVTAATRRDVDGFVPAVARLAALDADHVRRVLSEVLRPLLEDRHPDGVTGDDLRLAVAGCLRRAAGWATEVDPQLLVMVLAGVFGVHAGVFGVHAGVFGVHQEGADGPITAPADVARHTCLLIADLLGTSGGTLGPYLDAALTEISRADRNDD